MNAREGGTKNHSYVGPWDYLEYQRPGTSLAGKLYGSSCSGYTLEKCAKRKTFSE